jgi:hypothetical protein
VLYVQSLLKGLPDSFDSFKTSIRLSAALTPDQLRVRVLAEDAAMAATASYAKVTRGAALAVGEKRCTVPGCRKPNGHTSDQCWITHPELKKAFAKKRDQDRAKSAKESNVKANVNEDTNDQFAWSVKGSDQVCNVYPSGRNSNFIIRPFNMDSGCTTTIVNSKEGIVDFDPSAKRMFNLADKSGVASEGTGIIGNGKNLKVHIVPSFAENLLSIPQLYERNIATVFHPTQGIMIADAAMMTVACEKPLGTGRYADGTFLLDLKLGKAGLVRSSRGAIADSPEALTRGQSLGIPFAVSPIVSLSNKAILWYQRLGYPSIPKILDALRHKIITGINLPSTIQVSDFPISAIDAAQLAKSKAQPHRDLHGQKHSKKPYEMLHIDFKYMGIRSWGGAIGASTIVDDYSSRIHRIPIANKGEFISRFKEWVAQYVESRGYKINVIRSDNGSEIKNYKFNEFLTYLSARAEFTSTYSPQSDGVAERANQTVLAISNTLRLAGKFPEAAWAEG